MQSNLPGSDQALDRCDPAAFLMTTRPVFSKGLSCKKAEWLNRSREKHSGNPKSSELNDEIQGKFGLG